MNTITEEVIKGFTDEELYRLHAQIEAEEERRKRQYKAKLITDFQKAWGALKDNHINIKYYFDDDESVCLRDWYGFSFE